ncbi:CotH kinase family protein [Ruminococcus sp. NK3A76]|uniref:CotH kinase family protein n=1 Tax=Ruminococcus sp. NK3A76 TaxID=877411 RepID=UPI000490A370|nr:CotH kinase family protein [Ruminococcus sp. NK3A76]
MKKRLIPLLAAAAMLAGCAGSDTSSSQSLTDSSVAESSKADSSKADSSSAENVRSSDLALGDVMPVLAIETEKQGSDALDFATKPVARHVAENIAGWTPGYQIPDEPYYEQCSITVTGTDGTKSLDSVGAQVKVRGNWTTTYDKKPLRIKFDEKQSLLGLNGGNEFKNWVLLAEYKDGSMLRNKAAFDISNDILGRDGLYASDSQLVEVTINGEYFGVYLLCEYSQVNQNRIDITKPDEGYEGTDIGYFLEFDGYYSNEDKLHGFKVGYNGDAKLTPYDGEGGGRQQSPLSGGRNSVGITIKSDIYSQAQHDFIAGFVDNVYNIMYHAAYDNKAYVFDDDFSKIHETSSLTPQQAVEKVVDVDSLADMYIISELTCDADLYWSSFFMYADFGEGGSNKLIFANPWDFDSALGNKERCEDGTGYYAANTLYDVNNSYTTINPWLAVLMYQDWYTDIIKTKWKAAYDSGIFDKTVKMITDSADSLAPAFERNYDKWDNIRRNQAANELSRSAAACKTQAECAEYLAEWLKKRVEFMNGCWN